MLKILLLCNFKGNVPNVGTAPRRQRRIGKFLPIISLFLCFHDINDSIEYTYNSYEGDHENTIFCVQKTVCCNHKYNCSYDCLKLCQCLKITKFLVLSISVASSNVYNVYIYYNLLFQSEFNIFLNSNGYISGYNWNFGKILSYFES